VSREDKIFEPSTKQMFVNATRAALENMVWIWLPLISLSIVANYTIIPSHLQIPYTDFLVFTLFGIPTILVLRVFICAFHPDAFQYQVTITKKSLTLNTPSGVSSMSWDEVETVERKKNTWLLCSIERKKKLRVDMSFFDLDKRNELDMLLVEKQKKIVGD